MNAKEFWISKYPDAEKDWGKTGHDDRFQVRMMEEYAEYRVKKCDLADVVKPKGTFYCVEKEVNADECETQCSDCERWTK